MEKELTSQAPIQNATDPLEIVKEVKKELADYRRPFEKSWRESDDAYYGKQHKTGESVKTVKNHIFKIIEGEVPILTDSMPGTQVTADTEERQQDADNLNKAIKYVYQDQNLPLIVPTLVRSSLTSAPGYLYALYNPDADGGDGKIEYIQLPWESVFLDGNAQTIEQSEKGRIEIPKRREALARIWPEYKDKILELSSKPETSSSTDDNFEQRDVSGGKDVVGKPKKHNAKDIVKYVETWVKSYDLEDISQEETIQEIEKEKNQFLSKEAPDIGKWENHDAHDAEHAKLRAEVLAPFNILGDAPFEEIAKAIESLLEQNPEAEQIRDLLLIVKLIDDHRQAHAEMKKLNPTSQKPKYPDGWRLIKSVENVLLYDGPNPEGMDKKRSFGIPLVPFYCYKDDTIYGFSEVKNILDPQRSLNDVDFRELEGLRVVSNPGWVADKEAEVDANSLTNEPGIVVKKKKGTEVRRLEPGQVSPQLERRKMLDAEFIEDVTGVNRESQGNMAASASGIAIQKLQTQAIGRIRLKDRYLQYYSMKRLATITACLILNNWTNEKRFRLRSDDSNIETVLFNPFSMHDLGYSIQVSPGSMAGLDKDALNNFFMMLLDKQHISFEEFLMVADFPKKEILLKKLKEREEQAKTLEQLQAELVNLQQQNASLLGLVDPNLPEGDQKKVFEIASKQALIEKILSQSQPQEVANNSGMNGANNGQPNIQGNM